MGAVYPKTRISAIEFQWGKEFPLRGAPHLTQSGEDFRNVQPTDITPFREFDGRDVVWLDIWERNPRAIIFYRKWGFVEAGPL
jgi:hypothetical protein